MPYINPQEVVKDFIRDNFTLTDDQIRYDTRDSKVYFNESWFEQNRLDEVQLYFNTGEGRFPPETEINQRVMGRDHSLYGKKATEYFFVASPTEALRATVAAHIFYLFQELTKAGVDTLASHNPVDYVDDLLIEMVFPMNKDTKQGCEAWIQIFEIAILY